MPKRAIPTSFAQLEVSNSYLGPKRVREGQTRSIE